MACWLIGSSPCFCEATPMIASVWVWMVAWMSARA
jgi:hypothetical protein